MNITRRLISLFLAVVLLLSMGVNAFAVSTDNEAQSSAYNYAFDYEAHLESTKRKEMLTLSGSTDAQMIESDYVEFYVDKYDSSERGRFTIGNVEGNPNYESDDGQILLYGHSNPWSSYTTVVVDDYIYLFNADSVEYFPETLSSVATMEIKDDILVEQKLQIVQSAGTGLKDTVQISYAIKNQGNTAHNIGVRIMLDTMLGHNDGAPFKVPSLGNVTYERELIGNAIPAYWQAFDDLDDPSVFSVGTFYKEGERKPDKVQFTNWGHVNNIPWDYTINPNYQVTGDSAVSVYWNSTSIPAGQSTSVCTYYGVGYASDSATSAGATATIPTSGFGIVVLDENNKLLPGAKVTAKNVPGQPTVTADAQGVAIFNQLPTGTADTRTVELDVSLDSYQTTTSVMREVTKGGFASVTLVKDDGRTHILAAQGKLGNYTYDLFSAKKYFKSNADDTAVAANKSNAKDFTITVTSSGGNPVARYQLIQGGEVVVESTTANITIPVLTGTPSDPNKFGSDWRITQLKDGLPVYLRTVDNRGVASEQKLLSLVISKPTTFGMGDTSGSLKLGEKLTITVPSNVAILGGTEIELGWNGLPFEFEVDESGKVKFAINGKKDATTGKIDYNKVGADYEKALQNAVSNRIDAAKAFGGKPTKFGAGSVTVDADVMGYGEGYVTENGTLTINVGLVITISQSANYTWTFFLGYVPVYIAVGEKVSCTGTGTLTILADERDIEISGATGSINPKITINVDGGVGANGVLNVGVSGRATLSYLHDFSTTRQLATLTGDVCIVATAFLFKAEKKIASNTWTLYDSYSRSIAAGSTGAVNQDFYDSGSYTPMDRSYLYAPATLALGNNQVKYGVYPDADPTLVKVGNTSYLFWLEDIYSRADNDRTALVYATSTDLETWSSPVQIIPDSYSAAADFAYDVCVDGDEIHIALSKANQVFGNTSLGIDDMAAAADIYYVKLDTDNGQLTTPTRLTNDSYSDILPSVAVDGNQVAVTFAQNKMEDGLFGDSSFQIGTGYIGSNQVEYDAVSGAITELTSGTLEGSLVTSYILDTDGDYNTAADTQLWVMDSNSNHKLSSDGNCYSPLLAMLESEQTLLWYENGDILYVNDLNSSPASVFDGNTPVNLSHNFQVNENSDKILWEAMDENETTTRVYAVSKKASGWSSPYVLFDTESELSSCLSGYWDGQTENVAYLKTVGIDYDPISSLCVQRVEPTTDTALLGVSYDFAATVPGQTLPLTLTVQNAGSETVDSLTVECNYSTLGTINNLNLEPGEVRNITFEDFNLPSYLDGAETFKFGVYTDEQDYDNNYYETEIGYTDLAVDYNSFLVNGQEWLNITVRNNSGMPADALLRVVADETDGAVLYENTLPDVTLGSSQSVLLNLSALGAGTNIATYYIMATTDDDLVAENNMKMLYLGNSIETTYNLSVSAGYGGTLAGTPGGLFRANEEVQLEAVPNNGYIFVRWESSNGGTFADATDPSTTFTMPDNDTQITAIFEAYVPHAHSFNNYVDKDPATCTTNKTQVGTCSCGAQNVRQVQGTALGHSLGQWYVAVQPTFTRTGEQHRKCTRCGVVQGQVISKLPANGWHTMCNNWYYYRNSKMVTGWLQTGGTWYYFDTTGKMATGWLKSGNTWYYFNASGAMQTGWVRSGSTWYYFNASGAMATGWLKSGNTWYYFKSSGAMATGWVRSGNTWYYFDASGAMQTGWVRSGSTWYYFNASGAMQTGWLKSGNSWYYFHSSGAMATGVVNIGGSRYVFNASGVWIG